MLGCGHEVNEESEASGAGFVFKIKIDMAIILILLYIYASELRDNQVRLTENEKNQELKRFSGSMVVVSMSMCVTAHTAPATHLIEGQHF